MRRARTLERSPRKRGRPTAENVRQDLQIAADYFQALRRAKAHRDGIGGTRAVSDRAKNQTAKKNGVSVRQVERIITDVKKSRPARRSAEETLTLLAENP